MLGANPHSWQLHLNAANALIDDLIPGWISNSERYLPPGLDELTQDALGFMTQFFAYSNALSVQNRMTGYHET